MRSALASWCWSFLFLRHVLATFIPSVTIPCRACDLRGHVSRRLHARQRVADGADIAVGFIIDDAVVMIENIMRHIGPASALLRPPSPVARDRFTIVSMTLSLTPSSSAAADGGLIGACSRVAVRSAWRLSFRAWSRSPSRR